MATLTDYLRRALIPRLMVRLSRFRTGMRLRATLRRTLGGGPRIELFFAYDDPYSAIAMDGLLHLAARYRASLQLYPLREHGIAGDPAAEKRRLHAVQDSRLLARRNGRQLSRTEPLAASDCAFLAEWTEAARTSRGMTAFAAAALNHLWFESSGAIARGTFQPLRQQHLGDLSQTGTSTALARNSQRLHRLGHWESPAARVEGEWFFAHERLEQIEAHLKDLGWLSHA